MTADTEPKYAFTYLRTHKQRVGRTSYEIAEAEVTVFASNEDVAMEQAMAVSSPLEGKEGYYLFLIKNIRQI